MNPLIPLLVVTVAGLARAAAATELVLPVAPYAGPGAADAPPRRWNVLVQDITLERTLQRWGAQAGVRLKWDAQRNFLIGAPDSIEGTFETALRTVLDSAGIRSRVGSVLGVTSY